MNGRRNTDKELTLPERYLRAQEAGKYYNQQPIDMLALFDYMRGDSELPYFTNRDETKCYHCNRQAWVMVNATNESFCNQHAYRNADETVAVWAKGKELCFPLDEVTFLS